MHKHRKKPPRLSRRTANANYRLSQGAVTAIMEIISDLPDNSEPHLNYLKAEFLSKYCDDSLVPSTERRQSAISKFLACEERNASTNASLPNIDPEFNILGRVSWTKFIRFCRRLTRDILGPLHDGVVLGSFSGGASTSRRRTESLPAQKFTGTAHTTEACWKFLDIIYREAPLMRQYGVFSSLIEVPGNILFTVPKKTDIDRCACKEPDINMFLQKGVGNHIRSRLRKHAINLNDQSRNRDLAREGSITGTLATIDLSSASDSISIEAVRLLLPTEWFEYLNDIRSHFTEIDGVNHRLEMFSSMGNGFTFELESLIFFVLCRAVQYFTGTPGVLSVYGDDIILPSEIYYDAEFVLQKFGFSVNGDKSFHQGPFRESCGGHYHNGEDITPFYLKRKPVSLTDLIRVTNQFRRWAMTGTFRRYESNRYFLIWKRLRDFVPRALWGGCDLDVDTQLVSPHPHAMRLCRIVERAKVPQAGRYVEWHNNNWNRSDSPTELGYEPQSTIQICRLRPAKLGAIRSIEWFYEELLDTGESSR